MLRPNGQYRRILEEVQLGTFDWVRITAETRPHWAYPSLFIRLPQGVWMSAGLFWRALKGDCGEVQHDNPHLPVVVDLLDDGVMQITKCLDGGEVRIVLKAEVVEEIKEVLRELRERHPRSRHLRHPAMRAEAAS